MQRSALFSAIVISLSVASLSGCATQSKAADPVVQRNPAEQFEAMRRAETQIDRATREVPDAQYVSVTRQRMVASLEQAGFSASDAREVMSRVDEARADRAWAARFLGEAPRTVDTARAR